MRTETQISRQEAFALIKQEHPDAVEPPDRPNTTYFRTDEDGRMVGVGCHIQVKRVDGGAGQ